MLVDPSDAEVLAGEAADRRLPIASTTKLMTAYVARRKLRLGERVTAPGYSPISPAESLLGLVEGEQITTRDLLYGLLLASGNDAAEALAVASAGSVEAFVRRMNREADRLGLDDTNYANPIGLDDPANYSSANDLVTLAAELRQHPIFREIFDAPAATLESGAETRRISNRNTLVVNVPFVDGVKTGYTLDAGNVLVASGTRDGVTLISAVLGEPTESARDADSLALLEYGFSLYRQKQAVKRGERLASAPVAYQGETLALLASRPIEITVRRGQDVKTAVDAPEEVEGPIERGERLGRVIVTVDGERRGRSALIAARAVAKASIADRLDSALPGPRPLAWLIVTALIAAAAILLLRVWSRLHDIPSR